MKTHVAMCLWITCALTACSFESTEGEPDGGHAGTGGFDAGRDASAGIDGGRDARGDGGGLPESWIATKTTLDVWWQGVPTRDPGRDEIEIVTLTKLVGACDGTGEATIKVCGIKLPTYTSDVGCEAFQLEIPDSIWDSPDMPTFTAHAIDGVDAGDVVGAVATALIGIDVNEDAAWPTGTMVPTLACNDGTGAACFPDHDGDNFPGVTAHFRTDGAIYAGPYDDGLCTNGWAYRYRAGILVINVSAGGGPGASPRVDQLRLGMRTRVANPTALTGGCDTAPSDFASVFELRTVGCTVDPTTLDPGYAPYYGGDPRLTSMDYTCTANERLFIDENLPQYRVLASGERPGESLRPNGWIVQQRDRDIDKRVSTGTRTQTIALSSDDMDAGGNGEPTCAQVRAAFE